MKNIFKYFIVILSLFILFGLTGCPNFLELDVSSDASPGGILITISGDGVGSVNAAGSRTLFPSKPVFTRYELHFENTSGANVYASKELSPVKSEILIEDLALGTWIVTAVGYITINGKFERAADGEVEIEVKPGNSGKTSFQSVNIPIKAKPGNGSGVFSYNINFPSSINTAQLFIYDIGGSPWDVFDENVTTPLGTNQPVNVLTSKTGRITLKAGYYMMTIKLSNGFRAISWTEVIHIYTNMETVMEKIFDETYISGAITLSGKASALINGVQAERASLYLYTDVNCTNMFTYLEASKGSLFPVTMQSFETPVTFYIKMNAELGDSFFTRHIGSVTLHKSDYVFNINEVFHSINVGGTSNITINGNAPAEVYIRAYRADNNELLTVNAVEADIIDGKNGAWRMALESFIEETEVYFEVQAVSTGNSVYYKRIEGSVRLFNTNKTNIHLQADVALLTVSGIANIKVNGAAPIWATITMREVTANQEDGIWLDSAEVNLKTGNTWTASVNPLSSPINVYFEYACIDVNDCWHEGKINYQNRELFNTNITGIVFDINITIIDVAGTAAISVYGKQPVEAAIAMFRSDNDEEMKSSWIGSDQKWSMYPLKAFDAPTNVYFRVYGFIQGDNNEKIYFDRVAGTAVIHNTSILNFAFNITITELILSGTVTLNERFALPDKDIEIDAMVMDGNSFTGMSYSGAIVFTSGTSNYNWSIKLPSFNTNTTVKFRIRWRSAGDTYFISTDVTRQVNNSNVSGISLGTHDLYPVYIFYQNTDYADKKHWMTSINPYLDSEWQSLSAGGRVKAGDIYALHFTFTTEGRINDLDAVIRDFTVCECDGVHTCYNDSLLSDVRRVESNLDSNRTLSGTVIFTVNKNASSADSAANAVYLMADAPADSQPALRFTEFYFTKLVKDETSEAEWAIKVNGNDDVLKIVGSGITTIANIISHQGRDNVLLVSPGESGYYHFVVEYDLSAYAGQRIRININTDYWLPESAKIAWQVTAVPGSSDYPTVCGSVNNTLQASTAWGSLTPTSTNEVVVPPASTPGDDGKKLYLSAYQLDGKQAYFSNFVMTIQVVP